MSGSSSSGRSYSGGSSSFSETQTLDCSNLNRSTHVISPTMIFFSAAAIGCILKVELDEDDTVCLLNNMNEQVGGINPTWITDLVDCLKKGKKFKAIILKIDGASISVNIKSL